jgi:hypothetical protein
MFRRFNLQFGGFQKLKMRMLYLIFLHILLWMDIELEETIGLFPKGHIY